jgi:hypothetical protein
MEAEWSVRPMSGTVRHPWRRRRDDSRLHQDQLHHHPFAVRGTLLTSPQRAAYHDAVACDPAGDLADLRAAGRLTA